MTPQYIMRKSLCREPHCGYSEYYIADATKRKEANFQTALNNIENMRWAPEYAEPGYSNPDKGILFANWNYFPRGLDSILERYGYAVEWSDEWTTCDNCNKAVRTEPDGWDWSPSYKIEFGDILCSECQEDV